MSQRQRTAPVGHVGWPYSKSISWHQTVSPQADPLIAGRLGKVHRRPVVRAVLHAFVGSAEPLTSSPTTTRLIGRGRGY